MKNKKIGLFIFVFLYLFVLRINNVFAYVMVYGNCSDVEGLQTQSVDDYVQVKLNLIHSISSHSNITESIDSAFRNAMKATFGNGIAESSGTAGVTNPTHSCNDKDFAGWKVWINKKCDTLGNALISFLKIDTDCSSGVYCVGAGYYESESMECPPGDSPKLFENGASYKFDAGDNDIVVLMATFENASSLQERCVGLDENKCKAAGCTWNDSYKDSEYVINSGFCSPNGLVYLSCGDSKDIPEIIPTIASYAVTLLKTVGPIVLIVVSIISLIKATTAGKEDEIKKTQGLLLKRIIYAGLIFFTISIVQFIMLKVVNSSEKDSLSSCLSCFLNGPDDCGNMYYKDEMGTCYYLNGESFKCEW